MKRILRAVSKGSQPVVTELSLFLPEIKKAPQRCSLSEIKYPFYQKEYLTTQLYNDDAMENKGRLAI